VRKKKERSWDHPAKQLRQTVPSRVLARQRWKEKKGTRQKKRQEENRAEPKGAEKLAEIRKIPSRS
jgi:hypothetical protein